MATIDKSFTLKNIGDTIKNSVSEVLSSSDFISRTIGMDNSYEDIMFIVQALGRQPVSLLGFDYPFIFDHVRRNYLQGTEVSSKLYGGGNTTCKKFTFYKERPTIRFANPDEDPQFLIDRWFPSMKFGTTLSENVGKYYSEAQSENSTENRQISHLNANNGVAHGIVDSFGPNVSTCDLIKKTNDNFNKGLYKTLVARFHTGDEEATDANNPTQTANSRKYGMSHGRNLLKCAPKPENGYDNPYCRVWTYHHQYNQASRAIRPFYGCDGDGSDYDSAKKIEDAEGGSENVSFRVKPDEHTDSGFEGGSARLDKHGVLDYKNGFVHIAPTAKIKDYFDHKVDSNSEEEKKAISIKKCMFSIENLAWRDTKSINDEFDPNGLSPEQRGPFGGRIMWFPPYDINFSETVSVDWNPNRFIGRGESVWTYTNTERTGTLGFKIIIDHPSIIDYWTGHEKNGMKNKGKTLYPGNTGGVDSTDNQEQTLLRFFAGCDILTAQPQKYKVRTKKIVEEEKEEVPQKPNPTPPPSEVARPMPKKIVAILYYPNNYSGVDDRGDTSVVNPIYYLMNGVGTQEYVKMSVCQDCGYEWYPTSEELSATITGTKNKVSPLKCPICGSKKTKKNLDRASIPTTIEYKPVLNEGSCQAGYEVEVSGQRGVSNTDGKLADNVQTIKKSFADPVTFEKKAQFLTTSSGERITAGYNTSAYTLSKIIGNGALSLSAASKPINLNGKSHWWYRKRYYYRCDKAYEPQDFSNPNSYIDRNSYGFNGNGFVGVREYPNVVKSFEIEDDSDTFKLISFTDLFVAFEGENNNVVSPSSEDNVKLVRDVFENKDKYTDIKITIEGHASYQGYVASNSALATNRAETLRKWMSGFNYLDGVTIEIKESEYQPKDVMVNVGELDDKNVKMWRSASVVIEYNEMNVDNASTAELPVADESGNVTTDRVTVESKEHSTGMPRYWHGVMEMPTADGSKTLREGLQGVYDSVYGTPLNQPDNQMGVKNTVVNEGWFDNTATTIEEMDREHGNSDGSVTVSEPIDVPRYDNEGEFFELLTKNEPFLHHLITDKIKYFDPAYHAISPEGFNARLTFLHQCTRQGSTVEHSAFESGTANNLAFGRPPVCILRVGDFFYTKIIITNLQISYEDVQWDLNPEGIGVMPMFANISISFTFIGGSDIAGPIARLQNAVSFNYYANTSVYDNRAEEVEYNPDGSGREIKFKGYHYPLRKPAPGVNNVLKDFKDEEENNE